VIIDTFGNPYCHGESSGYASASSSGGTAPVLYRWSNNSYGALLSGLNAGTYSVTAIDGNGCNASATATLSDPPTLTAIIIPQDTSIAYGDSLQLHAIHTPSAMAPSYIWEPSNLLAWCVNPCPEPFVFPLTPTTFTLTVTSPDGHCSATAQAFVDIKYNNILVTPNAFTPDGDGVNDEFQVFFGPELTGISLRIFNRWGDKLFESHTIGEYWDGTYLGKPQNPGTYVYMVEARFLNKERKNYSGSFVLLR
jgi:gliding motility-associated-like protein